MKTSLHFIATLLLGASTLLVSTSRVAIFTLLLFALPVGVQAEATVTTLPVTVPLPWGVAVDGSGNIYVSNFRSHVSGGAHTIDKVTPEGVVTTLAGSAGANGSADGTGSDARFYGPAGVAVDGDGNVYVADFYNDLIRKVTPSGVVTTLAGTAGANDSTTGLVPGTSGSGGSADGTGSKIFQIKMPSIFL